MVPDPDCTPLPSGWWPDHEKILLEYIKPTDQPTLEEQRKCIREEGLITPHDCISKLVHRDENGRGKFRFLFFS